MKTRNTSTILFLLFTCILIIGCNNDDDELIPDPIAEPTDIGLGVRLSIDSIVCLKAFDKKSGFEYDHDIEIYGYIKAWSSFDYTVGNEKENYEKLDKSMLWYRDYDDYYKLVEGDALKIGKITDFFFDNNKAHLANLHIDFFFAEFDNNEASWGNSPISNHIMYTQEFGDDNEREKLLSFSMEDIEYYDRVFQKTHTLYLRNQRPGDEADMQIEVHYSFHPVIVKSAASLPEGYSAGDEIIEPDLFPEIPSISAYAAAPPAKSKELVVGQKVLSKFSPEPLMVPPNPEELDLQLLVYGLNPKFVSGSQLVDPVFDSEKTSNHGEEDPWNGLLLFATLAGDESESVIKFSDNIIGITCQKLQSKPIIQMVRYWVPINVERVAAGVTLTTSTQITHGVGKEFKYELSITTGITATSGITTFNQRISQTFGFTVSYSYSITTTKTKEIAAPDDKNVSFITWQLVEEFRVVDENGEMFTDPNYDFKSMLIATIPTDHIVEEAHQFSAY